MADPRGRPDGPSLAEAADNARKLQREGVLPYTCRRCGGTWYAGRNGGTCECVEPQR